MGFSSAGRRPQHAGFLVDLAYKRVVPDPDIDLDDLVDLKMLPAWVNEPAAERYAHHQGEQSRPERRRDERRGGNRQGDRKRPSARDDNRGAKRSGIRPSSPQRPGRLGDNRQKPFREKNRDEDRAHPPPKPKVTVRFVPHPAAVEKVTAQIKSDSVAFSLYALARLFLEKPARYEVHLTVPVDAQLWQIGEHGAVSLDWDYLDRNAFRLALAEFYRIDITESEPIKGNFTSVARCRTTGTLLGPTNHHDYQRRLRNLYEQRFSRRMSFGDYQRQIENISDPALVESWKEEARKTKTFMPVGGESPQPMSSEAEAERHFRQHHLPGLIRKVSEVNISAANISDRVLRRVIEDHWTHEVRSPSPMMQELAARFRTEGLHIFRHRRGMLFVTPVYPRTLSGDQTLVSPQVRLILETLAATPRTGRKELADKIVGGGGGKAETEAAAASPDDSERAKLSLASDLRWLVSEGYVIEFNDGSLDLPRAKAKEKPKKDEALVEAVASTAEPEKEVAGAGEDLAVEQAEIGGS